MSIIFAIGVICTITSLVSKARDNASKRRVGEMTQAIRNAQNQSIR